MSSQNKQSGETPGKHDDVIRSGPSDKGGAKGKNLASIEVAVPIKQVSPFEDSSSSGTQSRSGFDTPATSITPAESDTTSKRPRKRVNASARALELRNSSYSLNSASSSKKRGIGETSNQDISTESSDARLARALQAEEYGKSNVKRAKHTKSNSISGVDNSTDEDDDLLADMGWAATDDKATTSRKKTTASKGKGKAVIPDSDESSLSDLDLESAEMEDVAAVIEDSEMEDEEYEYSAANDKSEASEEEADEEIPVPVTETRTRPSARSRQRTRPSRRRRKVSSSPDMSPSMSRLTRRVRLQSQHSQV